jgi:hypothetical protein
LELWQQIDAVMVTVAKVIDNTQGAAPLDRSIDTGSIVDELISLGFTQTDLADRACQKSRALWLRYCFDEWQLIKPDIDLYLTTIFEALRYKAENTDITNRWRLAARGFESLDEMIESAKQVKQDRSSFRLSVEQIIHGCEVVHNIVWEATKLHFAGVHSHIKMGLVCPLFKSPTRTRPVTLLHGIDKICVHRIAAAEAVILRQTASPHHFGGMPGRTMNTAHQITMMLWDQVEADENDVNIHFDYTDSSSAFHSSQPCILLPVWKPHHLPHNVARIRPGSITGHRRLFRVDRSITSFDQCASLGGGGAQGRATSGTVWQATLDLVISALNSSVHPLAHSNIEFTTTLGVRVKVLTALFISEVNPDTPLLQRTLASRTEQSQELMESYTSTGNR